MYFIKMYSVSAVNFSRSGKSSVVLETNLLKGIMVRMREEVVVGEDLGSRRVGPGVIGAKPE